jgi:allantoinase
MLTLRSTRVVFPDGMRPGAIHVDAGRIIGIGAHDEATASATQIDAGDLVIAPGLVDTHVHVNEPGRTHWEGFASATRAAAAGGVTTLVDMPLNSIPATTSLKALEAKLGSASGQCSVDVAFWGGVVPGNTADLEPLARAGVRGFKCFLAPSGVDEFEHVTERDLRDAMPVLARLQLPLLAHAELPALLRTPDARSDPRDHRTWLESRPAESEHAAIDVLIRCARQFDVPVHIVHLAAASALPMLAAARANGVRVTVETCPHYLTFAAEDIPRGATAFKCAPPLRERDHRERLWQGLLDRDIDLVATDHSPAPPDIKDLDEGDFVRAWGGIASLQLGLAVVWTGARARGATIAQVSRWLATAPAQLAGLDGKGAIAQGKDADLIIWDPDETFAVDPAALHHRHAVTPYGGMRLYGRVHTTLVRGDVVFDRGTFPGTENGRVLLTPYNEGA